MLKYQEYLCILDNSKSMLHFCENIKSILKLRKLLQAFFF